MAHQLNLEQRDVGVFAGYLGAGTVIGVGILYSAGYYFRWHTPANVTYLHENYPLINEHVKITTLSTSDVDLDGTHAESQEVLFPFYAVNRVSNACTVDKIGDHAMRPQSPIAIVKDQSAYAIDRVSNTCTPDRLGDMELAVQLSSSVSSSTPTTTSTSSTSISFSPVFSAATPTPSMTALPSFRYLVHFLPNVYGFPEMTWCFIAQLLEYHMLLDALRIALFLISMLDGYWRNSKMNTAVSNLSSYILPRSRAITNTSEATNRFRQLLVTMEDRCKARASGISSSVTSFMEKVTLKVKALAADIEGLKQTKAQLENAIRKLENRVVDLENVPDTGEMVTTIMALSKSVESLKKENKQLQERVKVLQDSPAFNNTKVVRLSSIVDNLEDRVTDLENIMENEEIVANIQGHGKFIEILETNKKMIENKLNDLESLHQDTRESAEANRKSIEDVLANRQQDIHDMEHLRRTTNAHRAYIDSLRERRAGAVNAIRRRTTLSMNANTRFAIQMSSIESDDFEAAVLAYVHATDVELKVISLSASSSDNAFSPAADLSAPVTSFPYCKVPTLKFSASPSMSFEGFGSGPSKS